MTGPVRLPTGGVIDRSWPLDFTFDGRVLTGFAGDTIASALLGNGVRVVGRSFKRHRPRGVFTAGFEESNAIVDLVDGDRHDPNARATTEPLRAGMAVRSIHAHGTAEDDRLAWLDRFAAFIPAGFYYKTFMRPHWSRFEPRIRALAGLGRLARADHARPGDQRFAHVEALVVGAGPAGLAAARAACRVGRRVMVVDDGPAPGGTLLTRPAEIDGRPSDSWIATVGDELRAAGAIVLDRATAFAVHDHGWVAIVERTDAADAAWNGERLWRVRTGSLIVAAGAAERPMVFRDNDRPGVMLADGVLTYLRRYAVRAGDRAVVAAANDAAHEVADALAEAGADVIIVDGREGTARADRAHDVRRDMVVAALGRRVVEGARLASGVTVEADLIAVAGGWTPRLHLFCLAGGTTRWDGGAFVPGTAPQGVAVAGAANGSFELAACLAEGHRAGGGRDGEAPRAAPTHSWRAPPALPGQSRDGHAWVDLQNDVTAKDIAVAVAENYATVEHLKRYTTLGMATDQGKTSNLNGLAVLAAHTGQAIGDLGQTTFRPPYVPVSLATLAGARRGPLHTPVRRLPAEPRHRADGAWMREYGGILRPAWYGRAPGAVHDEAHAARIGPTVFDASPLGKIEVIGPQAADLVDFVFYNTMSTLRPGRLRYGLMLTEGGIVFDDGVVARLAKDRFVVSCSSSHVPAVAANLEEWRQDCFDTTRVFVHDTTGHWATVSIAGPGSRAIVAGLDLGADLDDAQLPHMALAPGRWNGTPARIARVSFIGERGYEVSVRASQADALWRAARAAGARPIGVEALSLLRAEKGYIIVGQDTDGETMPHDLGIEGPRRSRTKPYVGDRSLALPVASRPDRRQLVGLEAEGEAPLPAGTHAVERAGGLPRSLGYVTSSYLSPTLGRPIALGLIAEGRARLGMTLTFQHLGRFRRGRVVPPCALDPEGRRLNG